MDKYPLIGVSICAVVLLVLGSLSNVVGYQTVQSSNQKAMNTEIDPKELLFQTIIDIANNKEIQGIILKSQLSRGIFPTLDIPVLTKNKLKQMYFFGLILSKVISKSRIQSMVQQYQFLNQGVQKEISAVIEKNPTIKGEITQLKNSECDCKNEKAINWSFPVICSFLAPLALIVVILYLFSIFLSFGGINVVFLVTFFGVIWESISNISHHLNCFWTYP